MNRRGFMKLLAATPLIGLAKLTKKPEPDFCADCQCKIMDGCNCKEKSQVDFFGMHFPEAITGFEQVEDRMLVFCERSVWEMYIEESSGLPLTRFIRCL